MAAAVAAMVAMVEVMAVAAREVGYTRLPTSAHKPPETLQNTVVLHLPHPSL